MSKQKQHAIFLYEVQKGSHFELKNNINPMAFTKT